jgi:hypothetical protein
MVLLVWPPAEHLGSAEIAAIRALQPCRSMTNVGAERLLKIPAARGPRGIFPAAQLKRE